MHLLHTMIYSFGLASCLKRLLVCRSNALLIGKHRFQEIIPTRQCERPREVLEGNPCGSFRTDSEKESSYFGEGTNGIERSTVSIPKSTPSVQKFDELQVGSIKNPCWPQSFDNSYTVFNVEQCDGLTLPEIERPTTAPEIDEDEFCESIVTGWENRPALHLASPTEYRAYYRPRTDSVHLPARSRFVDAPHYYSTLFHELVHSTGHESRLNRVFGARFGDGHYSKEELVAEMGAAFLCAIAGIANEHTDRSTTAYIQNWIAKLEEDNRLIVYAAANAQRAVDLIVGSTFAEESETTENAGDAAGSGFPATFAVNPIPAIARCAHF